MVALPVLQVSQTKQLDFRKAGAGTEDAGAPAADPALKALCQVSPCGFYLPTGTHEAAPTAYSDPHPLPWGTSPC